MHRRLRRAHALVPLLAFCIACVSTGCGSTVATSTGPSPTKCGVTLAAPATSIDPNGAAATVAVNTQPECSWNASSEVNWITGVTPAAGQGAGDIHIDVAANPSTSARQGNIIVNGVRAQVRQEATVCQFDVSPAEQNFPASGGTARLNVSAAAGCAWTARPGEGWVTVTSGSSGSGPGVVAIAVASNAGGERSASVAIADRTVRITQASQPAPVPPTCTVSVTPQSINVDAGSTSRSVSVSTSSNCSWSASSSDSWISISGTSSGSGSGTVSLSISSNSGDARNGSVTIGGETVDVTQAALSPTTPTCSYTVSPLTTSVPASGGNGTSINVQTVQGCAWTATSTAAWLTVTSGANGSGGGTVAFTASANTGTARTGTLSIAGQTVTVSQPAPTTTTCSYSVNPTTVSIGATGSTSSSASVTTTSGCAWTATSNVTWVTVSSGASGNGSGNLTFAVAANTGTTPRTGTLTVAGQTLTINESAATPCSYTVAPTSASIGVAGASGQSLNVTTSSTCAWTATSNANWITIASGSSGTGNGTVTYAVLPNTGSARTGTLTVAGQTVTISQSAACTYTIAPTSQTIDKNGGSGGPVTVTTQSGCAWTAASNVNWITVTSGASGTGSGTVSFTVAANTGAERTGTLTIAGSTFTVTEQKR